MGPEVRRVRGCLIGNPGAGHPARETRAGLPGEPRRAPWDPARSLGCLTAPAPAILCPGAILWLPAPVAGSPSHLEPLGRSPARRSLLRLRRNGCHRASRISSLPWALLPGAGRCHEDGEWAHPRPVAGNGSRRMPCGGAAGISAAPTIRAHGESNTPSFPEAALSGNQKHARSLRLDPALRFAWRE